MSLTEKFDAQRAYFQSGETLSLAARRRALEALLEGVTREEGALLSALEADLGKGPGEGYLTELGLVRQELRFHLRNLSRWARPRRAPTPLAQFPGKSLVCPEPLGVAAVIVPWNYPVQLALMPLIGALSAGCCALLALSPEAPACARALDSLLSRALPPELACVVPGGPEGVRALLDLPLDHIFFTGSPAVGRQIMAQAARQLIPVTLELGGKSPVLLLEDADLPLAARRVAFGKLLNAGQTCVAPDYVLVPRDRLDTLVRLLIREFTHFLGNMPLDTPDCPRIINSKHLERLKRLLAGANLLWGGQTDGERMAPALVIDPPPGSPLLEEEIFGPILPLIPYDRLEDALAFIQARPRPLALYLFTRDRRRAKALLARLPFGGGCVNDTVVHLASPHLPFGGVGGSGMGRYHGKASFDAFTHEKSLLLRGKWPDIPLRYRPYTPKKTRILRWFLR